MDILTDFLPTQPYVDPSPAPPLPVQDVDLLLPLAAPPRKARLLIVDDQPIHLQVLYRILSADYQLFMATSGTQAVRVCRDQLPDLVLLDVVMPDMDGFEVLQQLRSMPETTDIPVFFLTAHAGDDIETKCLEAGAVDFIPKPVNPNVVRARVKTHLTLKFQSDFLRDMAFMDGLTGVFNRRYFDQRSAAEWGRAQRKGTPLSLMLLDVDFFKPFNDHYGHQAGDDCLRQMGALLKAEFRRPTDTVARYGGEEFVCLLPDTGFDDAMQLAQKLLLSVKQLAIAHAYSGVAPVVTVSLGLACRSGTDVAGTASDFLALADAKLYEAKHAGRDRVCGASMPAAPEVLVPEA
jgi:diguanylate cyclase (GGDEF)-like protein